MLKHYVGKISSPLTDRVMKFMSDLVRRISVIDNIITRYTHIILYVHNVNANITK